jgi:hypothetical protein
MSTLSLRSLIMFFKLLKYRPQELVLYRFVGVNLLTLLWNLDRFRVTKKGSTVAKRSSLQKRVRYLRQNSLLGLTSGFILLAEVHGRLPAHLDKFTRVERSSLLRQVVN